MQIEEGKFYLRRDGKVIGPAQRLNKKSEPIGYWEVGVIRYFDCGYFIHHPYLHPFDLIDEAERPDTGVRQ